MLTFTPDHTTAITEIKKGPKTLGWISQHGQNHHAYLKETHYTATELQQITNELNRKNKHNKENKK